MRVFLIEPYDTGSHRRWVEGYRAHSRHEVVPITLEGRFWKWRLTGGHVTMAESAQRAALEAGPPDVLLGTSMLDLAGFLGLVRRSFGDVPAALYLHENQVTYPILGRTRPDPALGLVTWGSLLAADAVAFNSEYHRAALLGALPRFLGSFPDERHTARIPEVGAKAVVLPVGVDLRRLDPPGERTGETALILWNHRWDPDKDPGSFLAALADLAADGVPYRVVLAGERLGKQAEQFARAIGALGDRVVAAGHLDEAAYREVLRRADIVASTAHQEFFGISIVEAMYAGAFPVLPHRLVYPERIPIELHRRCLFRTRRQLAARLRAAVEDLEEARRIGARFRALVGCFDWSEVAPRYDDWLDRVAGRSQGPDSGGGGAVPAMWP
jgi:glycosyltransferase involved in cell wall biosynthesis